MKRAIRVFNAHGAIHAARPRVWCVCVRLRRRRALSRLPRLLLLRRPAGACVALCALRRAPRRRPPAAPRRSARSTEGGPRAGCMPRQQERMHVCHGSMHALHCARRACCTRAGRSGRSSARRANADDAAAHPSGPATSASSSSAEARQQRASAHAAMQQHSSAVRSVRYAIRDARCAMHPCLPGRIC
jgi:hypothetical protein